MLVLEIVKGRKFDNNFQLLAINGLPCVRDNTLCYQDAQCTLPISAQFSSIKILHLCFIVIFVALQNEGKKKYLEGSYLGNVWCNTVVKILNVGRGHFYSKYCLVL